MKVIFVIWGDLMAYIWTNGEKIWSDKLSDIENEITDATELTKDQVELIANKVQSMEGMDATSTDARNKYPSANALLAYINNNLQDATYKQY